MSIKFTWTVPLGVAAAAGWVVGAMSACNSLSNPPFDDAGDMGTTSSSGGSTASSGSSGTSGTSSGTNSGSSSGTTSGSSSGHGSSGSTGSSSGTGSSSSGSGSGAGSSSSSGAGSTSSSSGAGTATVECMPATATAPTITAAATAIPFNPTKYQSVIGMTNTGGYAFEYADTAGSFACLDENAFCAAGMTAIQTAAGAYGAGVGINLNQIQGTMTTGTFTPTGKSGIAYALSALPAKMVMIVDNNGVAYQATLAAASGMIPWASFTVQIPDAGAPTLSGPPVATHINFQVSAGPTAGTFSFCVTSLSFY